jgi:hypothetical protein
MRRDGCIDQSPSDPLGRVDTQASRKDWMKRAQDNRG